MNNDNDDPLHFATTTVSQGGMTNQNSGSRIKVPTAGSYLITAAVSGEVQTHSHGDGIRFQCNINGTVNPSTDAYPIETTGSENGQEYCLMFTIILDLGADDYIEVECTNIGGNVAFELYYGYFCAYKLG